MNFQKQINIVNILWLDSVSQPILTNILILHNIFRLHISLLEIIFFKIWQLILLINPLLWFVGIMSSHCDWECFLCISQYESRNRHWSMWGSLCYGPGILPAWRNQIWSEHRRTAHWWHMGIFIKWNINSSNIQCPLFF